MSNSTESLHLERRLTNLERGQIPNFQLRKTSPVQRSVVAVLLSIILFVAATAPALVVAESRAITQSSQQPSVRALETAETQSFELNTEQKQEFRITLNQGEYLHVVATQDGIDFSLRLTSPSKTLVITIDSPTGLKGDEDLSLVAQETGEYSLEVLPMERGAANRNYTIRAERKTTVTQSDLDRATAVRLTAEAQMIATDPKATKIAALDKLKEAREIWHRLIEPQHEARALMYAGRVNRIVSNLPASVEAYREANSIWQRLQDSHGEAQTLLDIGRAHAAVRQARESIEFYQQALTKFKTLNELAAQSSTLNLLGYAFMLLTNPDAAIPNYSQSLELAKKLNDRYRQNAALLGLGGAHDLLSEYYESLAVYEQALEIANELSLPNRIATTKNNIAVTYDNLGRWSDALKNYNEAMELRQSINPDLQIQILANMGMLHTLQGDTAKALEYYEEGLALQKQTKAPRLALLLSGIGFAWARTGDFERAASFYEQALPLHEKAEEFRDQAYTLTNLGTALVQTGDLAIGLQRYAQALAIWERPDLKDPQGRAYTLDRMGAAYLLSEKPSEASDCYRQALAIWERIKDPRGQASSLLGLARVDDKTNRLEAALDKSDAALKIVEAQRARGVDNQLRVSYLASKQEFYEFAVDLRMRLHQKNPKAGYDAQALLINERFRARSLIDTLSKARVEIRQGIDVALLQKQTDLQKQLVDKEERMRLLARRGKTAEAEITQSESKKLSAMADLVESSIRSHNPRYANLTAPILLSLEQIQREVLAEPNTLLVEYMLGEQQSYVWLVSDKTIESYVLPPRREIEQKALAVQCLLTSRAPKANHVKSVCEDHDETKYWQRASELSNMIFGRIAGRLEAKRLLIVADGALQYLPFAALPPPSAADSTRSANHARPSSDLPPVFPKPLLLTNEIDYLPSASTLAVLRRDNALRRKPAKTVAVIADPVFEHKDSRLRRSQLASEQMKTVSGNEEAPPSKNEPSAGRTDTVGSENGQALARLVFSADEARAIRALVPSSQSLIATGFAANFSTATSSQIANYRNLHFATHAIINEQKPELSGIALSRFDETGRPLADNFLRLQDIYNLQLSADLVVLSACRTALGKRVRGEGLMSLTRGFMYAGSKRVVSSLWEVDDELTAKLMERFYWYMLEKKMKPAAALRAAQIDLRKESPDHSPYFWAAFTIQGEWR